MFELYEVLYREGEEELKKYVLAVSEDDLTTYLEGQALDQMAYILVASTPEFTLEPAASVGTTLTKADDGRWDESPAGEAVPVAE